MRCNPLAISQLQPGTCSVCERRVDSFATYGVPPRPGRCPHCGAKPRNRAFLAFLLRHQRMLSDPSAWVLEIGPSKLGLALHSSTRALGAAQYVAVDIRKLAFHALPGPHRFVLANATHLPFASSTFALILCNNILPYIHNYEAALAEIARCLRPSGVIMLETHLAGARTVSARQLWHEQPHLTAQYFAENGDEWQFGHDFPDLVRRAGLTLYCEELFADATPADKQSAGFKAQARIMLARKRGVDSQ